ncbi:hypothetical protein MTR_8g073225 [Medicago truncatula]|uniref:Uncharacterized protein n=1 Tax=Medicago truncatula TaxID=3880 RepID=A0A072U3F2_MEDTR|nr:hypothetical protein MTR_8g073225 [Medicago truncatula]
MPYVIQIDSVTNLTWATFTFQLVCYALTCQMEKVINGEDLDPSNKGSFLQINIAMQLGIEQARMHSLRTTAPLLFVVIKY